MRVSFFSSLAIGFSALIVTGCGGGSVGSPPPITIFTPAPPPPVTPFNLYLATPGGAGQLQVFASPLSSSSTATATITPLPTPYGVLVDGANNRLFVSEKNSIAVYALPITSASVPAFSMALPAPAGTGMALDSAGNLYALSQSGGRISVYAPPFSAASVPSVITTGLAAPTVLAIDPTSTNLYVADNGAAKVYAFALPLTAASTPAETLTAANGLGTQVSGVAIDPSGRLIVSGSKMLQFFPLPLTPASIATFTISSGLTDPECMAFDSGGNMYVANGPGKNVLEYAPPFSATSAPTVSTPTGSTPMCLTLGK